VAELRYKAWGETRYTWGTTPTTVRFTGQREESAIGLYFYNARWYDPVVVLSETTAPLLELADLEEQVMKDLQAIVA